jgi:hypothetical protein
MDALKVLTVLRGVPFLLLFAYHVFAVFSFLGRKWSAKLMVLG